MPQRHYPNWLVEWCSLFTNTEVPDNYAVWTGIWTISSTLRNFVGIARGTRLMHPNLYVLLVGPGSGGKSYSADVSVTMLSDLGFIELFQGRMSESYMIKYLSTLSQKQALLGQPTNPILSIYSDELAMTVGSGDDALAFLRIMTQLYSSRFEYGTHAHAMLKVEKPTINWLALATVSWLRRSMPKDLIDSGFVARVITQQESLSSKIIPILPPIDKDKLLKLQADLIQISFLTHEYTLTADAIDLHDTWYRFTREQRQGIVDPITLNIYGREDEHALRVAMCLMASTGDSSIITQTALRNAIKLVVDARNSNIDLYRTLATGDRLIELKEYVKAKILSSDQPVTQSELQKSTASVVPRASDLREIIKALREEEIIEAFKSVDEKGILYRRKVVEEPN